MTDEVVVLKTIAERLDSAGLPYMVSGSVAMSFYARPRMTRDIDIVVELRPSDVSRLEEIFGADFSLDAHWARDSRSEMQLGDVRNLISSVKNLDWTYIERWANDLGVAHLLQEVRS